MYLLRKREFNLFFISASLFCLFLRIFFRVGEAVSEIVFSSIIEEKIFFSIFSLVYILLNKPIGYVTTSSEQFGRDKVLDLVKVSQRVVPVRKA